MTYHQRGPKTAWSSTVTLLPDGKSAGSIQALFADKPGDYVIQFDFSGPVTSAQADITWSVEGNQVTRSVTVVSGTRVAGCGQGVKVLVRDVTTPPIVGGNPYNVTVLITPGVRSSTQQPPYLQRPGTDSIILTNGSPFATIPIPQNVGAISYYIAYSAIVAGVNTALTANQLRVTDGNSPFGTFRQFSPVGLQTWVPLQPGGNNLQIDALNLAATTTIQLSIVWGIDG